MTKKCNNNRNSVAFAVAASTTTTITTSSSSPSSILVSSSSSSTTTTSLFSSSTDKISTPTTNIMNDNNNNNNNTEIPSTIQKREQQQQQQEMQQTTIRSRQQRKKWTVNTHVRTIMDILISRYGDGNDGNSDDGNGGGNWRRTRSYLYRSGGYEKLPLEQVLEVLDYLDNDMKVGTTSTTPNNNSSQQQQQQPQHNNNNNNLTKHIIQTIPRILRKPVNSFIKPTVEFLKELWGPELFQQAIQRNPQLLLSSGVGYVEKNGNSNSNNNNNNKKQEKKNYPTNTTTSSSNARATSMTFPPAAAVATTINNEEENYFPNDVSSSNSNVEQILMEMTNLSSKSISKLKRSSPFVFGLSPSKVRSFINFLFHVLRHNNNNNNNKSCVVGNIILSYPNLLNLRVETNLQPIVEYFESKVGFDQTDIAKLIVDSKGLILGLSLEKNIIPTIDYLVPVVVNSNSHNHQQQKQPARALQKCILSHPQILGLSLKNIQSKVSYFESISKNKSEGSDDDHEKESDNDDGNSIEQSSLSSKIAIRCPAVYSLSLQDNIIPTIEFLSKVWGVPICNNDNNNNNDNEDDEKKVYENGRRFSQYLKEYPNIITLSLEGNIKPTIDFFNRTGYTELNDNWELISTTKSKTKRIHHRIRGRYLASSLFNRLLPRWHYSISLGKSDDLPLHILVNSNDVDFCDHLGTNVEDFRYFKKETIPSLKFSSQFDTWLKTGRRIEI